jgi:tetratricopeptide (TPR) repeat protein
MRALLVGLSAGDIHRIARCVGVEVGVSAVRGTRAWRQTQDLINQAHVLAERCGTPEAQWYLVAATGTAMYLAGRFREAAEHLTSALEISSDTSAGLVWEQVSTRRCLVVTLSLIGRYKDLRRVQQEGLRNAQARAHVWGSVAMRVGEGNLAWLMEDRPDIAENQNNDALASWSKRVHHIEHHGAFVARINIRLYCGDVEAAYALACELVSRDRRTFLWYIQIARLYVLRLRACSALAMLDRGLGSRRRLVSVILRDARVLARSGMGWAHAVASTLRAGVALNAGARDDAIRGLEQAAAEFDAADAKAYAAAVRDRAARLRGGAESVIEVERTAEFFRAEQVVAPERFVEMLAPGFHVACSQSETTRSATPPLGSANPEIV